MFHSTVPMSQTTGRPPLTFEQLGISRTLQNFEKNEAVQKLSGDSLFILKRTVQEMELLFIFYFFQILCNLPFSILEFQHFYLIISNLKLNHTRMSLMSSKNKYIVRQSKNCTYNLYTTRSTYYSAPCLTKNSVISFDLFINK